MAETTRPALGQRVPVGALYDARADQFLPSSILPPNPPQGAILRTRYPFPQQPQGVTGVGSDQSRDDRSTHVVTRVRWGLHSILTMKHQMLDSSQRTSLEVDFQGDLAELTSIVGSIDSLDFSDNLASHQLKLNYEFMLYTDIQRDYGIRQQSLPIMYRFVQLGPQQIARTAGGAGYPIEYTLLPIHMFRRLMPGEAIVPSPHRALRAVTSIDTFFTLFDDCNSCAERLDEYRQSLVGREQYLARSHIDEIDVAITRLDAHRKDLQSGLRMIALGIRDGTMDEHSLQQLYASTKSYPQRISAVAGRQSDKLKFIEACSNSGATYIGFNGACINERTLSHDPPPYQFLSNNAVLKSSSSWNEQSTALREFLHNPQNKNQVFIVDCDAPSEHRELEAPIFGPMQRIPKPVIEVSEYHDMPSNHGPRMRRAEHRRPPQKCIARYDPCEINFDAQRPTDSHLVRIPCPGGSCDSHLRREWACATCDAPLEFGIDDCIYCDCGSAPYSAWDFKCDSDSHRRGFERFHSANLCRLLKRSNRSECRNILVLGQTGTFDEAKSAGELVFEVPCSFSVNHYNSSDPGQAIESRTIRVGSGENEHDGSTGNSATQKASVYRVTYRNIKYRIIDTPGIGDTRGPDQDKKNIKDIMNNLRRYEELHGILILLKTNETRISATFRFCFEELLSHLHRSAVKNIVFGFTHALISDYAPGDCLNPLQTLLKRHTSVKLTLCRANTYSFDAKSFHHLAAYFEGIRGEDEGSPRESWDKSRAETLRLLSYIDDLKPHDIRQTLSMEGAREALGHLMIPMVEISQEIRKNLSLLEERRKELNDTRLSGDELRKRLHLERIIMVPKKLDKPRTVCNHEHCCEDVIEECIGHAALINCRTFKGNKKTCKNCKHRWQQHMHILYKLQETKERVKDKEIERRLKANVSDVALRQKGLERVQQLEREYRSEQKKLRNATAQFVAYLRENSAKAFHDATEEYYDQLIKIEKDKIQYGKDSRLNVDANKRKLQGLTHDRDKHLELVRTIKENMHAPRDQTEELLTPDGVDKLIRELYELEHFGKNLKGFRDGIMHYKHDGKRPHHRPRSHERRSDQRSIESDGNVSDSSFRSNAERREGSGRPLRVIRGLRNLFSGS
ncbi:hypothetical protein FBEOM_2396 [Fusarium beomiforme]|uniref:G domain-containing protein n=1 Tax=Fusarium beomiforme TaxID=44412 RepID=A0A9P5ARJ1_9HYPO|nr:hypothetical protein FBEOM_2396 [Fusarium beomiforme]